MQPCPNCGKKGQITIGNKKYCTNCGAVLGDEANPTVTDLQPGSATTPAPPPTDAAPSAIAVKPAQNFHGEPATSKVLDLRQIAPNMPAPPSNSSVVTAVPADPPSADQSVSNQAAPISEPPAASLIKKFHRSIPATEPKPAAMATAAPAVTPPATMNPAPALGSSVVSLPVQAPTLAASPPPPASTALPNAVATQIDAMQKLAQPDQAQPALPVKGAPQPALVAAAAGLIVLMGGYIWVKNYPNLAIRAAANRAGISATLPAYLPAGFSLAGPVKFQSGEVTTKFNSNDGNLTITQRRTDWDSNSLLDNYVSKQSNQYLAIPHEGVTVYFYNDNQATWVNQGIWYTIEGQSKLNRDQILKIIESL